ncbi:MAG: DMT family transporter [Desulfococcaceae bacterium]
MERKNSLLTYTALTAAVIFWGLSFVASKMALESIPPFTLIFARFSIASCFFLVLMIRFGFPKFTRKEHMKLFFMSLFEPGLYFVFETLGLQHTTAAKASLIIATIPLAVTLFAIPLLGERPRSMTLTGIMLSFAGIAVLVTGDPEFRWEMGGRLLGDILIFCAVLSATFYIIGARDLGEKHSAFEITSLQILYGALFFAPGFLWELPEIQWNAVSSRSLSALVYLTVFSTVAAFVCYNYGLGKMPAARASMFINCIPVITTAGAWFLLEERLTMFQICGGATVLMAVFLSNLPAEQPPVEKLGESAA